MSSTDSDKVNRFMAHLLRCQDRLYYYVRSLEPRRADADDAIQETYLVLWEKFEEYHEGTSFYAWACRIAHYKILQHWAQAERNPLLLSLDVMQQLSDESASQSEDLEQQRKFLDGCLDKLPPCDLELIAYRYARDCAREKIAKLMGRSVTWVSKSLSRIRRELWNCIREETKANNLEGGER